MDNPQDESQENQSSENTQSISTPSYPQSNNPAVPQNSPGTLVGGAKYQRYSSPLHSDQGIVGDQLDLTTTYFDEYVLAIIRRPGASSIAEVKGLIELKKKFSSMFGRYRSGLDQGLAQDERVRTPLVMNLLAIVLGFYQGINLYTPMMQKTLRRRTHRVVEQAVQNFDFDPPDTLDNDPFMDIADFSRELYVDIKFRVDNVGEQLPVTSFVHEGSHLTDAVGRALGIRLGERSTNGTDIVGLISYQPFEWRVFGYQLASAIGNNPVRLPQDTVDSHSNRSITAMVAADQPSSHLESPPLRPPLSDLGTHDITASSSDTASSSSASQAGQPKGYTLSTASTPASFDLINCKTTPGDCAVSQKNLEFFHSKQYLMIWDSLRQTAEPYIALFDSGADENFIIRSVAHERGLTIYPLPDKGKIVRLPGGLQVNASEYVQPDWRLLIGRQRHSKFPFIILEELPGGLQLLVGERATNELGIHRLADTNLLTAHLEDGADCNLQELLNREEQVQAGSRRRDQTHQTLDKKHADAVQLSQARNAAPIPLQGKIKSSQGEQHTKPKP